MDNDLPFIVGVMITGKSPERIPWAKLSVEDFHNQTYPADRRHLLILQDSEADELFDNHPNQTELQLPREGWPLGKLRNYALDYIQNHFGLAWVAQWDDDDHQHPLRLEQHAKYLLDYDWPYAGPDWGSTLVRQIRYSTVANSAFVYTGEPLYGVYGTVIHGPTKKRYEEVGKHEDSRFYKTLDFTVVAPLPPSMYIRIFNNHNTWDARHIMGRHAPQKNTWDLDQHDGDALRRHISRCTAAGLLPRS